MLYHELPTAIYVYFDLNITDSNTLTKCKWCAAGDFARCNIFSNDLEANKQKKNIKWTEISLT